MYDSIYTSARSRNTHRFYLPENLPDYFDEYSRFVVSTLYLSKFFYKDRDPDKFWPLHSHVLNGFVGAKRRKPTLEGLLRAGVIETDGHYIVGQKSTGYRLPYEYQNASWKAHDVQSEGFREIIDRRRAEKQAKIELPVHRQLLQHVLDRARITAFPGVLDVPTQCLADGRIFFNIDERSGRVYTGYANLPNELRQFVTLDGERCFSVDIVNSQAFLLAIALLPEIELGGRESKGKKGRNKADILCCPDSLGLNDFLSCSAEGLLYERLCRRANEISATRRRPTVYDRDRTKQRFFGAIYGSPSDMSASAVGQALRAEFPEFYGAVRDWKMEAFRAGEAVPWGIPAVAAQKVEASVVVEGAAAEFLRQFPDGAILTQHDSLIVTERHVGAALDILRKVFLDRFGIAPQFKTGPWYDEKRAARKADELAAKAQKAQKALKSAERAAKAGKPAPKARKRPSKVRRQKATLARLRKWAGG